MKHRNLIVAFILIFCIMAGFILYFSTQENYIASIYLNGELIETINLNNVKKSYEINLPHNTILVENGDISVIHSDCPDKLCVKQGKISDNIFPIVCLPNKLVIEIKE